MPKNILGVEVHKAKEALGTPPVIDYVVDKVIPANQVGILVADAGEGKTYASLYAAACVANGVNLGPYPTTQGKTLYIDEEMGEALMRKRVYQVMNGLSATDIPMFYTATQGLDIITKPGINKIKAIIKDCDAKLVVIDSLQDVMGGKDENDSAQVTPHLKALNIASRELCTSFIVLHHLNKRGGYRGTTALKGAVDWLMVMRREGHLFHFEFEKSRVEVDKKFTLRGVWENDGFYLSAVGIRQPASSKAIPVTEIEVIDYLLKKPGYFDYLSNIKRAVKSAKNVIGNMINNGIIVELPMPPSATVDQRKSKFLSLSPMIAAAYSSGTNPATEQQIRDFYGSMP